MKIRAGSLNLARTAAALLACTAGLDFCLRCTHYSGFAVRPVEAAWNLDGKWPPFVPNYKANMTASYGDLAILSANPAYRLYRPEHFSSDERGFRSSTCQPPYQALALGTSETWGANLSDDETLAAQLSRRTGLCVYNGGAGFPPLLSEAERLVQEIGMRSGTVIYSFKERIRYPPDRALDAPVAVPSGPKRLLFLALRPWSKLFEWMKLAEPSRSPLALELRKHFNPVQNGEWLPNESVDLVTVRKLPDGRPMLYWYEEYLNVPDSQRLDISYWQELQTRLARRNLRLLMVLVPHKLSVYGPVTGEPEASMARNSTLFSRLETALRASDIPVVNLRPIFQQEAQKRFPRELLYWGDETHWNANGTALAAEQIAPLLLNSRAP